MAVLSEVIDGTTPITETHPEEKRAAIGTTWDSASDLTLKQVSDEVVAARGSEASVDARLDAEHGNDGTHSSGIIDQVELSLTSAGTSSGKATRYNEFSVQHVAASGLHNVPQATGTGYAVRWDDWTQEHTDAGDHRSNIIDQTHMALSSAGAATGDATRYDEFTQEHSAAGAHGNDIIDQAQMALSAASSATGEAVRHDEFSAEHTASTGAHRTDVAFITSQGQVNLGSAASASGDAVRYDEYNAHAHSALVCLYSQISESTAENTDASALASFSRTDATTNAMIAVRVAFYKRSDLDGLRLTGQKTNDSSSYDDAYVRLYCSGLYTDEQVTHGTSDEAFEATLDISSLADDAIYEVYLELRWATAHAGGDKVTLRKPQLWGVHTVASPV